MTIKELKKGDFFTLKPIAEPKESQVYIRGEYDRSEKKYSCGKFSDMCYERFFKGDKEWLDAVKAVEERESSRFISACQFVQKMKRKHHANPAWVWDVLGDNGILKGHGHILSAEEQADIEEYIVKELE